LKPRLIGNKKDQAYSLAPEFIEKRKLMESIDGLKIVDRQKALREWLSLDCGLTIISLEPMVGAASFRRYFRATIAAKKTLVVMDAPPFYEDCGSYIAIANALREMNLHTPHIIAADLHQGFLLISDFGDTTYLRGLNHENADHLYGLALLELAKLQACHDVPDYSIPHFNEDLMWQEWTWHKEWFLEKLLGLRPGPLEKELDSCFDLIKTAIADLPQVFMHRDFHSENLMILPHDGVGILDFQNAFRGPITYDLVSLLRDSYIDWPKEWVNKWVEDYRRHLQTLNVLKGVTREQFMRWFDWTGIERHLKALFTFARKKCRDDDPRYLVHVLRTLNYLIDESAPYPELAPLNDYMNRIVKPTFIATCSDKARSNDLSNKERAVRVEQMGEHRRRAMVLAAGQGKRMGELTARTPKPLLLVAGKYLIEYALLSLKEAGVSEIVINIANFGDQIKEALGCGKRYGLNIFYSEEKERLETGGGIYKALPLLGEGPFLVMSSDIITSYPLVQLQKRELSGLAHLVMVNNPPYNLQGDFGLRDGLLNLDVNETFTFANLAILHPGLFAGCGEGHFRLATTLLVPAIQQGKVTGEHFEGKWYNVGTPGDLLEVNKDLLDVNKDLASDFML
jgi:aminoglycoside/choline kinase family phosphotransferase